MRFLTFWALLVWVLLIASGLSPEEAYARHMGTSDAFVLWQSRDGRNWQAVGMFSSFDECQRARTLYTGVCLPEGQRP